MKNLNRTKLIGGALVLAGAMLVHTAPAMAQDGGLPVNGLLMQMDPATQERVVKEFFLT